MRQEADYTGAADEEAVGRASGYGVCRKSDVVNLRGREDHILDPRHREGRVRPEQLGGDAGDMRRCHAGATHGCGGGVA